MIVPYLDRMRYIGARISLVALLVPLLVALLVIGGVAAGATVAPAALAHAHLIGHPALANTCAGSQVPC